jgi:Fe-S oxidoreductase
MARCPIHLDVRGFLRKVAMGAWDEAIQVLALTMPFPGIVGRICDHPCQEACKRGEAGDAIAISDLERATVTRGQVKEVQVPLPGKIQRVAVIGGGLSSLTAAWDLIHKGYRVTLFELGGRLKGVPWNRFERILSRKIIQEETSCLEKRGVEVRSGEEVNQENWVNILMTRYDALYVGLDSGGLPDLTFVFALGRPDFLTLAMSRSGLFVGGTNTNEAGFSPIEMVAAGRKGATSIDRYLQEVSMTAGREQEGAYETRLYTSLEGVKAQPVVPMKHAGSGYSGEEAMAEAGRCIQCECMECVKVCLYLERFKSYPKRYIREIYNNETILMGSHGQTNRLINSCTLCDLCATVCPNDLSMAEVCIEGRRSLVRRGKMPPSAHEFALQDMLFSNSNKAALAAHEPGKGQSDFAFFPGCQLGAIYPDHVVSTYARLRHHLKGGIGLMLRCCGAPALWAAREDLFRESLDGLENDWNKLGRPVLVVACPACYKTLKENLPGLKQRPLWQVLRDLVEGRDRTTLHRGGSNVKGVHLAAEVLAIHDPCTARHEPDIQEAVRQLLSGLGIGIEELPLGRDKTECCGFGGLVTAANPCLAKEVAEARASRREIDYVTYCAMCRNLLASTGKRVLHVLDLLFDGSGPDPASRKASGYSDRRENRYRLKQRLLRGLWGGQEQTMEDYERIALSISPEVLECMEERRILKEDVQRVIDYGEKSGRKLYNPKSGRWLVSYRPAQVTYWVEYSHETEGFRVHNAYCHRMEIVGGGDDERF